MSIPLPYLNSDVASTAVQTPRLELHPEPDAQAGERLNVVLPHLLKNFAFGGVVSALEMAKGVSVHYTRVRFVSQAPLPPEAERFDLQAYVADPLHTQVEVVQAQPADILSTTEKDVFFCTYWTSVLIWEQHAVLMRQQGGDALPFYYCIQDFEPGFYPFGIKHAMSLHTYTHGEHIHALINSQSLADYLQYRGYSFARTYVLSPSLNSELQAHLEQQDMELPAKDDTVCRILVYGRSRQARNGFSSICEALYRYFVPMTLQQRSRFEVLSVGQPHPDMALVDGVVMRSLGKLSLPDYIKVLESSHVGISLMVSPHPSYPPLEMAVFGLQTVTNNYQTKQLEGVHPNLIAVDVPSPDAVLAGLTEAVRKGCKRVPGACTKSIKAELPTIFSARGWEENVARLEVAPIRSH